MKNSLLKYIMALSVLITVGCNNDDDTPLPKGYIKTVIPTDISSLYGVKGMSSKDTVIVYSHGGPIPMLNLEDAEEPQFENYYRVYVKQAQHINSTISEHEITFDQAIEEDGISTEMFQQVLKHFVDQDKVVIAMSHSFGSFILPNVLATKPNIANKYIIMAGRLDMPEIVWKGFRDGKQFDFEDGITPVSDGNDTETGGELSFTRLQAGLGKNRYTELLANKNLSNVIYFFGEKDMAVGALSENEVDFLNNKDAQPFVITNGDHSSMFEPIILDFMLSKIRGN